MKNKIKVFFNKIFNKVKSWFNKTVLPWLKKAWLELVNLLILLIVQGNIYRGDDTHIDVLVDFWVFILISYYVFWKFLGGEKLYKDVRKKLKEF